MKISKYLSLLLLAFLIGFITYPVFSQGLQSRTNFSRNSSSDLTGIWNGLWTAPDGYLYKAEMHLQVDTDNTVKGFINWTLKAAPRKNGKSKIGMKGVEFVNGKYYPESKALDLSGYRLDDPNHILGMDIYRLRSSDGGNSIGGLTSDHGKWDGSFILFRAAGE